jgi:hypothetical protein
VGASFRCIECNGRAGENLVRLQLGEISYSRDHIPQFSALRLVDGNLALYICEECSDRLGISRDDYFDLDSHLDNLSKGWCTLCCQSIEPSSSPAASLAVHLEIGSIVVHAKVPISKFRPRRGGDLCFICVESDLNINLRPYVPAGWS